MMATQKFTLLGNICNPGNKNYKTLRKETQEGATRWKTAFQRTLYVNIANSLVLMDPGTHIMNHFLFSSVYQHTTLTSLLQK